MFIFRFKVSMVLIIQLHCFGAALFDTFSGIKLCRKVIKIKHFCSTHKLVLYMKNVV